MRNSKIKLSIKSERVHTRHATFCINTFIKIEDLIIKYMIKSMKTSEKICGKTSLIAKPT